LIVRNVINKDDTGARRTILLSSELPPGKVHLLHRHPDAEQIMYVLEGSCLALSEGEPVRLNQGDACSSPRASGTASVTTLTRQPQRS
jgi:quercetin dioxygenase-like cupin family protein